MKFEEWRSGQTKWDSVFNSCPRLPTEAHLVLNFTLVGPFFFSSTALGHLRYIGFVDTQLQSKFNFSSQTTLANFNSKLNLVWYCDKVEWDPEDMRSKLSLSFTLSSPLGNKRLNFLSVQLPPAWMKGSDKTDQDFKVGILNEDRKINTDSEQSGSGSAGAREARLLFFKYFFIENKWTTETSFISSIKYCYLEYPCCLLCNPTTWVNQINIVKTLTQWNIARS